MRPWGRGWGWESGPSGPSRASPEQCGRCSEVGPGSSEHQPLGAALSLVSVFTGRADLRGPLCGRVGRLLTRLVHTCTRAKCPTHSISFNPHQSAEMGMSVPISQMRQMEPREGKQ